MSKSRTRKPTTTTTTSNTDTVAETAMDPSVQEQTTPEIPLQRKRDVYAMQALIAEVTSLFPETTYETSGANAFGANLVVSFDDGESPDLYPLLALIQSDVRVLAVDRSTWEESESYAVVSFKSDFRTQDSRMPFGLAEAYAILSADDESAAQWAENDERLADDLDRLVDEHEVSEA